jgi:cysteine synthase
LLNRNRTLLDATSGNTGIAYAAICRELGIRVTLCLPENASAERKALLQSLGADIILTSKFEGTDGAQLVARDLAETCPDKYLLRRPVQQRWQLEGSLPPYSARSYPVLPANNAFRGRTRHHQALSPVPVAA